MLKAQTIRTGSTVRTVRTVRSKICGIQNTESLLAAVRGGVDAVGFVFAESKRSVTVEQAAALVAQLPPFVSAVGVFANQRLEEVSAIAKATRLDIVQLHGEESPEYCSLLDRPVFKAFRPQTTDDLRQLAHYQSVCRGFLIDAFHPTGALGGTGTLANWELAKKAKGYGYVCLAGGLHAGNVAKACQTVQPFAVDASSGVESSGVKDIDKIHAFLAETARQRL